MLNAEILGFGEFMHIIDSAMRRRIGEAREGRCRLMGKTPRGEFGMPDDYFFKVLDAP
jgi:hypothetical protein